MIRRLAAFLSLGLLLQAQVPFEVPMEPGSSCACPFVSGALQASWWSFGSTRTPVRLLLDTGAETNLLKPELGEGFGSPERVSVQVKGSGEGRISLDRRWTLKKRRSLRLGPIKLSGLSFFPLLEASSQALERHEGLPCDGILGLGELGELDRHLLLEFDPGAGRLRFHPAEGFDLVDWVKLPTRRRGKLVMACLKLGGRELEAVVDTGFSGGLQLSRADAQGLPFQDGPPETFQTLTVTGLDQGSAPVGRLVTELAWGEARMAAVPVERSADGGDASLLGARFWMAGRWLLDPRSGDLWVPRARLSSLEFLPEPPRWGFDLERVNPLSERMPEVRITQVRPGSAADRAGLRVGDRLCGVETLRAESLDPRQAWPLIRESGRTRLHLDLEREGRRLELTLALTGQP